MSSKNLAVSVRNLGKSYVIAHNKTRATNLREAIVDRLRHPMGGGKQERETFWALKDVDFDIRQGESIGVIGRNGAGKSTLLKLLSRITSPTTGGIDIHGRVASLLEVGTGFHPELTGRENVYLNGTILGMTRREIDRKFDQIVEFSGVEQFLDTPVKRYSSGMHVRLAFAVAAHLETDILIIDEVLAVGDAAFQKKCLGKIDDVLHDGRTVLFVSHNMSAVSSLCERVLLMEKGQLTYDGPTNEGLTRYVRSVEVSSSVDLSLRTDRSGPGDYARLTKLSLFDGAGEPSDNFAMGSAMTVELKLECEKQLYPAEVGFALQNMLGVTIHYFVSAWEGLELDLYPGKHCFRVTLPHVLVFPGNYLLTPWVKRQGQTIDDQADAAIKFTVVGSDLTGHHPYFERYSLSKSEVYSPSEWRLMDDYRGESKLPVMQERHD